MARNQPAQDCTIEGCIRKAPQRGLCPAHYQRWRKYGDPLGVAPKRTKRAVREAKDFDPDTVEKFWSRIAQSVDCWEWQGAINPNGYGMVRIDDRVRYVHRIAYELAVAIIPEGGSIDHRCGNRACANPAHLRLATAKQNVENLTVMRSDNTSGYRGVTRLPSGRWMAQVNHNGKHYYLGSFATVVEAAEVARRKRNELFTHNDRDRRAA